MDGVNLTPSSAVRGGPSVLIGSWAGPRWITSAANDYDGWIASGFFSGFNTLKEGLDRYRAAGGKRAVVTNISLDLDAPTAVAAGYGEGLSPAMRAARCSGASAAARGRRVRRRGCRVPWRVPHRTSRRYARFCRSGPGDGGRGYADQRSRAHACAPRTEDGAAIRIRQASAMPVWRLTSSGRLRSASTARRCTPRSVIRRRRRRCARPRRSARAGSTASLSPT